MPNQSLSAAAYSELRSRITRLQIPPGTSFTEREIASDLGLSKTPVREALSRLRQEDLVIIDPAAGYRSSDVTIKDTWDLFALRVLLEGEAAGQAAGQALHLPCLRQMEELCDRRYSPADAASVDAFLEANTRFHLAIGKAAGNRRLEAILEVVLVQMERLFRIGLMLSSRSDDIVHEHRELLEAIVSGDASRARKVAVAQVRASQKMVIDAMVSSAEITTRPIGLTRLEVARHG